MQAGKVEVVNQCRVCGANLSSDSAQTCGRACAKELRKRHCAVDDARRELADAALLFAAMDPRVPTHESAKVRATLDDFKALEKCAVVYTVRAKAAGRLP